jgi:predicted RNase H-like HicB family nuclease
LATSSDVQGLVAQGRTVSETLEIARDVVRRLMEARSERSEEIDLLDVQEKLSIPLVVGV